MVIQLCFARRCSRHTLTRNSSIVNRSRFFLVLAWIFCCFISVTSSTEIDLSALSSAAGFQIVGSAAANRIGYSVSRAGDVNGDGVDDILIGGNIATAFPGETNGGIVYVVFGNKTAGSLPNLDMGSFDTGIGTGFRIRGRTNMMIGTRASRAGDIDADGYDDFVVSAAGATSSSGRTDAGVTYVFFGRNVVSMLSPILIWDRSRQALLAFESLERV